MAYTNSSLATARYLSPNHSGTRNHSIDRITPHCVVGQLSGAGIGGCFKSTSRQASCNYGIGTAGDIVLIVEEKNRSWCSSSAANDNRAVTIECASNTTHPYAMNSAVYNSLVKLCVDICRRNGKNKLLWISNKTTSLNYAPKSNEMVLTVHRWFANKACPGQWLVDRLGSLATEVTKQLGGGGSTPAPAPAPAPTPKKSNDTIAAEVIAGKWGNNPQRAQKLRAAGYDPNTIQALVNQKLSGKSSSKPAPAPAPAKKSNETIAQEVLAGKWGNNPQRAQKLKAAGYDPNTIQALVNQKLGAKSSSKPASSTPAKKSIDTIASEVIAGKWGNGATRKKKLTAAGYNYSQVQAAVNRKLAKR